MEKVDSNVVGLSIAEEASLKTLPATPVWYEMEPNSFSDFGGDVETKARTPLNAGRQRKKGVVTGVTAAGGFNTDLTHNGLFRHLQGFFFADAHEKPATQPLNSTQVAITAVASPANTYAAASGLSVFKASHLVLASGFSNAANNGLKKVTTAAAGLLTVSQSLVAEASPPATAKLEAVGFEFASGDLSLTASASSISITSAAVNLTTLGLIPGEWIFIGGDNAANKFTNNTPGYARIRSVSSGTIQLSETTFAATTDAGTGKTVQIFFGSVVRNEKTPSLIKQRTYQLERQLGMDANGVQSEYLIGSAPDTLKLSIPKKDKIGVDLGFVSLDTETRDGATGVKAGTRVAAAGEDCYNSSSHIYRMQLEVVDPVTLNPSSLFGYVSDLTLEIKNGVSRNEAIGEIGGVSFSNGDFEVSGDATAYFTTVAAVSAIRANKDVCLNVIAAKNNAGFVVDLPLLTLSGGKADVKKDSPVMLPLKQNAAEGPLGYTALVTWFNYLPSVGMPD